MTTHDYTLFGLTLTGATSFAIVFVLAAETLGKWLIRKWGGK